MPHNHSHLHLVVPCACSAQFSLNVHKGGLKQHSFSFHPERRDPIDFGETKKKFADMKLRENVIFKRPDDWFWAIFELCPGVRSIMTFYHPSWHPCVKRTGRAATRLTHPRPELHSRLIAGVRLGSSVGRIPPRHCP